VSRATPPGYTRLAVAHADVVAHDRVAPAITAVFEGGARTLHEWAAQHPERRELSGRIPAYSAPLPGGEARVVVRRSHHGGLLAPLLGDRFLPPTRAPLELAISLVLGRAGVPTPPVAAYAIYPAGPVLRRADVLTVELAGRDLGAALRDAAGGPERHLFIAPVVALLASLTQAGAWHPDLNVKNILLTGSETGSLQPVVLDVDRVRFSPAGDPNVREANLRRLARSVRKWREQWGRGFDEAELATIREQLLHDEDLQAAHRALALQDFMP
jgi:Lipopolysaccharide kinase (Kdo/WaaP) family